MTIRLPDELYEKLKTMAEADPAERSQNQLIVEAFEWYLHIANGEAHEEVSWRLGEAAGLQGAATWLERREMFLGDADDQQQAVRNELKRIAEMFHRDSVAVTKHARRLRPTWVRYREAEYLGRL